MSIIFVPSLILKLDGAHAFYLHSVRHVILYHMEDAPKVVRLHTKACKHRLATFSLSLGAAGLGLQTHGAEFLSADRAVAGSNGAISLVVGMNSKLSGEERWSMICID